MTFLIRRAVENNNIIFTVFFNICESFLIYKREYE